MNNNRPRCGKVLRNGRKCGLCEGHNGQHYSEGTRGAANRKWYQANLEREREKSRLRAREHRLADPEGHKARARANRAANVGQYRATRRAWYWANVEKERERMRENQRRKHGWYEPGEMATGEEMEALAEAWKGWLDNG